MYRKKQLLWPYTILPSVNQINVFMKTKYMLWRTFDRFAFWRTTISMQSCVQVLGNYLHQRNDAVWSTLIRWEFMLFQPFDDPGAFSWSSKVPQFTPSQLLNNTRISMQAYPHQATEIQWVQLESLHIVAYHLDLQHCQGHGGSQLMLLAVVVRWRWQSKSTRLRALAVIPIHDHVILVGLFQDINNMRAA